MIFDTNNLSFVTFIVLFVVSIGYLSLDFRLSVLQNLIIFFPVPNLITVFKT